MLLNILLSPLLLFNTGAADDLEQETHTQTKSAYQDYARARVGEPEYRCLKILWHEESGWSVTAYNESSGAYGIPQALPGAKMATVATDWQTNGYTQVKWGIRYINERYGDSCAALAHKNLHGWY